MDEQNLDAESVTRNQVYGNLDHLQHLLKIGWSPDSHVIKKFLIANNLTNNDVKAAIQKLNKA